MNAAGDSNDSTAVETAQANSREPAPESLTPGELLRRERERRSITPLHIAEELHLDARIALARAICEAAQSRLSHIHGGRDDITHFYATRSQPRSRDVRATLAYREAFDTTRQVAWDAVPSVPCGGVPLDALLTRLIGRLRQVGFKQVLRHRFDRDLGGLHVVKVVVPGCEFIDRRLERMGPRLRHAASALEA